MRIVKRFRVKVIVYDHMSQRNTAKELKWNLLILDVLIRKSDIISI
jgi:lactate dehydrogenase-like 2-hydroxyacid dehydrogenase